MRQHQRPQGATGLDSGPWRGSQGEGLATPRREHSQRGRGQGRGPEEVGEVFWSGEAQGGVARAVGAIWAGPGCSPPPPVPPPPSPRLSGGWAGPGLLLLIALTGYTLKNAWKNDVFFSWSYFSGWLAVPFYILAGNLGSGKGMEENIRGNPPPRTRLPSRPFRKPHSHLPGTPQHTPLPAFIDPHRDALGAPNPRPLPPSAPGPRPPPPRALPSLPPGFCFLLADMILQSTEAIGGFPVCL